MAILQAKPKADPMEIPPELRRAPNGKASDNDALLAKIAELEAKLAAKNNAKISLKVSEKGTVSAYGLGRFAIGRGLVIPGRFWPIKRFMHDSVVVDRAWACGGILRIGRHAVASSALKRPPMADFSANACWW
jgi:hypothetical protein